MLPIRQLDQQLGILAEAARRLPDPRSPLLITHSVESLLSQRVYQILAGYPDGNDAQLLKHDPLFKICVGKSPSSEAPLASGSTMNRFLHAYTRREAQKPLEDRSALFECRDAQLQRIRGLNEFLVDVFARTRKQAPAHVIIDLDPTDDACHGHQQLSFWHGFSGPRRRWVGSSHRRPARPCVMSSIRAYCDQNQYFPMLVFDGETGLPLAAWLRPGKLHAACGAVEIVQEIVARLRAHFPNVTIFVRGDSGVASPEMYEFCEAEGLFYAFGYASHDVLKRRVAEAELEHEAKLLSWITRRPAQVFGSFDDYQAGTWSRPRRVIAKAEITETGGLNTRFVVSNMSGHAAGIDHGFYMQRGNVPERPIGELKNGLAMDRLSSSRFLANSQKLLVHVLAYLLWSLLREANADVPELAKLEVGTARALVQSRRAGAIHRPPRLVPCGQPLARPKPVRSRGHRRATIRGPASRLLALVRLGTEAALERPNGSSPNCFRPRAAQISTPPTAPRLASTDFVSDGLRGNRAKSPIPPPKLAQTARENVNQLTRPHHPENSPALP